MWGFRFLPVRETRTGVVSVRHLAMVVLFLPDVGRSTNSKVVGQATITVRKIYSQNIII
jgi:hypothetical protein